MPVIKRLRIGAALAAALAIALPVLANSRPARGQDRAKQVQIDAHRSSTAIRIWSHGSWCWFGDPRSVRVVGQYDETFVGWIDWAGAITIGAYDARFGVLRKHVIGHLYHDDHGSPAIFVEPDKRLTVFFSAHNGDAMFYRSTLRPQDISAWGPIQRVASRLRGGFGFTYPNPVLLPADGNRLYLFWRGSDWGVDYARRSIDGRWSPARRLISAPGQRPYLKVDSDGIDTVALAFTNGHPRERVTSVYYATFRAGSLWHADGRRIARLEHTPISPQRADVIYNARATGISSWVWDVAFGAQHRPVVVYATFPSASRHVYWYAAWSGRRWISHLMTYAGPSISPGSIEAQYSGGITLDHSDPSVVYLSRMVRGVFEIERWSTSDGGYSWHHVTVVRTPGSDNIRPVVPRGSAGGPTSLLWLHGSYGTYTSYRTSIAFLR